MATIVTYWIYWQTSDGELKQEEVDIDFNDGKDYTDSQLDETGRRYLIADTLQKGGRVIKLRKIKSVEK